MSEGERVVVEGGAGRAVGEATGAGAAAHPAVAVPVPQGLAGRQVHVLHAGGFQHVARQQAHRGLQWPAAATVFFCRQPLG